MGVGAHALDELHGRPLRTRDPRRACSSALAVVSIAAACAIGIGGRARHDVVARSPFVAFGAFVVVAYNLELFGGAFHCDLWFAPPGARSRC